MTYNVSRIKENAVEQDRSSYEEKNIEKGE
jgi:hypothetical protein